MTSIDRQGELDALILQAIESSPRARLVEGGTEWEFFCPSHSGSDNPHAYWNRKKAVWSCAKCGAKGNNSDLATALNIVLPEIERKARADVRIEKTYDYLDSAGALAFQVCRMAVPPGAKKEFRVRKPDPSARGGWTWKMPPKENYVLYRLPVVLAADEDDWILFCEGEKDADRAVREGYLHATTNPFGAQAPTPNGPGKPKWEPQYTEFLRNRNVVLCFDADAAGRNSARQVAQILAPHARRVITLELPGLPTEEMNDLSDWFSMGNTIADLRSLIVAEASKPTEITAPAEEAAPDADVLLRFAITDTGNAEMFAHLYGQACRYDHQRGRWLLWKGDWWGPDADGQLYRWAAEAARHRARAANEIENDKLARATFAFARASESAGKIEAAIKLARAQPPIADPGKGWDEAPMLIGVANGVVNLTNGELRRGRQDDRITLRTEIPYDPTAECPRWLKFLDEIFEGDKEMVEYLQRAIGYSLTGSTKEQVWFLLHGKGQNGKSTLLETIQAALGDYAGVMPFTALEKGKEAGIPTDLASLPGKRFVTASEANPGAALNEARIKMLTGDKGITARQLYEKQFTFTPQLKLFVGVNHLPSVRDSGFGFWRRVRVLGFRRIFSDAEKDPDLPDKLQSELPGVLRWAVDGAVTWHTKGGLRDPQRVLLATVEYKNESDPIADFIRECCVTLDHATARANALFMEYSAWADRRGLNGFERLSSTKFGREMGDRFQSRHTMGGKEYLRIGLRFTPKDEKPAEHDGFTLEQPIIPATLPASISHGDRLSETGFNPSYPSGPCLCLGRHEGKTNLCAGSRWWRDTDTDPEGVYHCVVCHPPEG